MHIGGRRDYWFSNLWILNVMCYVPVPKCWQGPLWGEAGAPCAGHSQCQLTPMTLAQGDAVPHCQHSSALEKWVWEKFRMLCVSEEWGKKIWEIALRKPRLDKKVRGEVLWVQEPRFSRSHGAGGEHGGEDTEEHLSYCHARAGGYFLKELQPTESPEESRFILKDCSLWKTTLEQGKAVRRKE